MKSSSTRRVLRIVVMRACTVSSRQFHATKMQRGIINESTVVVAREGSLE